MASQKAAMAKFAMLDGAWRGAALIQERGGALNLTQTERVGPMLGGTIRVIEGRAYEADGRSSFNAFAVISYEPDRDAYDFHTYSEGRVGTFPIRLTADGFTWELAAGPAIIRYTATVTGDTWRQIGERLMPGRPPQRIFEMTLTRLGDTDWPATTPVPRLP
jgi:hypothetical protein